MSKFVLTCRCRSSFNLLAVDTLRRYPAVASAHLETVCCCCSFITLFSFGGGRFRLIEDRASAAADRGDRNDGDFGSPDFIRSGVPDDSVLILSLGRSLANALSPSLSSNNTLVYSKGMRIRRAAKTLEKVVDVGCCRLHRL
jgi:hypothetical protein